MRSSQEDGNGPGSKRMTLHDLYEQQGQSPWGGPTFGGPGFGRGPQVPLGVRGLYYWKRASRKEEIKVKMMVDYGGRLSEIIVRGDDEQVEQMRKELQLCEKGMIYVKGLFERSYSKNTFKVVGNVRRFVVADMNKDHTRKS